MTRLSRGGCHVHQKKSRHRMLKGKGVPKPWVVFQIEIVTEKRPWFEGRKTDRKTTTNVALRTVRNASFVVRFRAEKRSCFS